VTLLVSNVTILGGYRVVGVYAETGSARRAGVSATAGDKVSFLVAPAGDGFAVSEIKTSRPRTHR